ncbi:MAG: hypothetical protein C0605_12130 [Hyphomicrobiales bacterium]|nr:MAG: hypothetical protein C0605_12130 [Hyphomicrobiales bacterium]
MLIRFPFLALILIAYNAVAFFSTLSWDMTIFELSMVSGAVWRLDLSGLMLIAALLMLFIELIKATRTDSSSLWDHALSTLVFILFLIEFLLLPQAATTVFFLLTLIALIDVIAGYSITIRAARRDFAVGGHS